MPTYTFNKERFYPIENGIIKNTKENKRFVLPISINRYPNASESWLIILKNPSKAGQTNIEESDCTVNRVCEYFYNRKSEVKEVIIMNLFPLYETHSKKLVDKKPKLIDQKNKDLLEKEISSAGNIVIAWGEHPSGCKEEFNEMKDFVSPLLKGKNVYQMKHPKYELNSKRPLHGQVWGYEYELIKINPEILCN